MQLRLIAIVVGPQLAYAIVRYHVFKGVPLVELPLYTVNKAIAWSSLTLCAIAIAAGPLRRRRGLVAPSALARDAGRAGAVLAGAHVLLSGLTFLQGHFAGWFEGVRPGPAVALLTGAAATWLLLAAWRGGDERPDAPGLRRRRTLLVALTGVHVAAIGLPGWLTPATWPGLLPPITLLSFLTAAAALVIRALDRRR